MPKRIIVVPVLFFACLAGCVTTEQVAPYERGHLQRRAWREPDTRSAKLKGHVYSSKEASSGGAGRQEAVVAVTESPLKRLQPASPLMRRLASL